MKLYLTFESFWNDFHEKPTRERRNYIDKLSLPDRRRLINSFFSDGWATVFVYNIVDQRLDLIKNKHGIDLIELRIQAISQGKVFLIDKEIWDEIEDLILEFDKYFDSNLIFGNLLISSWGKRKQFYRIRATRRC